MRLRVVEALINPTTNLPLDRAATLTAPIPVMLVPTVIVVTKTPEGEYTLANTVEGELVSLYATTNCPLGSVHDEIP